MADRVLRDHDGKCVHGVKMYCGNVIAETGKRCPGGREVTATPMYRQGGLSGAWYPMSPDDEDEPDGYLMLKEVV